MVTAPIVCIVAWRSGTGACVERFIVGASVAWPKLARGGVSLASSVGERVGGAATALPLLFVGTARTFPQLGHLTVLPAAVSGAVSSVWHQAQGTRIGINRPLVAA